MAYKKEELYKKAKKSIVEHNLFFISDIQAYLGITPPTYYKYFPLDSDESNEFNAMIDENRAILKVSMRSKWYKSNAPALQMALMKIIATPEELKKLSMQFIESENKNENINIVDLGSGSKPEDKED